ncbi:MAG: hypothetical protein J5689_02270 [Clostridia bacterium]|nr:hypothetical protein [Clostridia bacterium]
MAEHKEGAWGSVLDWLGGIAAFLTLVVFAVLAINAHWDFLGDGVIYNILVVVKTWAPLTVVAITALEFCSGKSVLFKIIFVLIGAIVVVSMFFPETWEKVIGIITE